ncbi:hypothetical protein TWF281_011412 [Arthrobotrys megalospora]
MSEGTDFKYFLRIFYSAAGIFACSAVYTVSVIMMDIMAKDRKEHEWLWAIPTIGALVMIVSVPVGLITDSIAGRWGVKRRQEELRARAEEAIVYRATAAVAQIPEEEPLLRRIEAIPAGTIALFDGESSTENSKEAHRATNFFNIFDKFHESYGEFVTTRSRGLGGGESPQRIRIAVLDTGIDFRHPGIMGAKEKGRVKKEWCHSWVNEATNIEDEDDGLHGTNCVYLLHKVAPEAEIYVGKVFASTSFRIDQSQNIPKAIEHAVKTWNVDIISMSFGLRPPTLQTGGSHREGIPLQSYRELIDNIEKTIVRASAESPRIMFAAASNNGKNERRAFPARFDHWVTCVHASDGNGNDGGINPAMEHGVNFMTLGMGIELMERQWVDVRKQIPMYRRVYKSGTSFATPIAAGIAATVLDLAVRVDPIKPQARNGLRRPEGMMKMFRLMSTPNQGSNYTFLVPWNHWRMHWQVDEIERRHVWDSINRLFGPYE